MVCNVSPLCFVEETKGEMPEEYFDMLKMNCRKMKWELLWLLDSEEIPVNKV